MAFGDDEHFRRFMMGKILKEGMFDGGFDKFLGQDMYIKEEEKKEMAKFKKGYSYLVSSDYGRWYLVHQTGLKSWRAMIFTHVMMSESNWGDVVIEGNATSLHEKLRELANGKTFTVCAHGRHKGLRRDMFDILKTGKIGG
ncbi:MAG: hypothetical protein KAR40_16045 [Candidatus Sabulitectum sp.]|nr:hypothetical protein [Candidatus Sabulitectum sp.]